MFPNIGKVDCNRPLDMKNKKLYLSISHLIVKEGEYIYKGSLSLKIRKLKYIYPFYKKKLTYNYTHTSKNTSP